VVSTHLKNISQNGNLPQVGDENKKYLKPPPTVDILRAKIWERKKKCNSTGWNIKISPLQPLASDTWPPYPTGEALVLRWV